MLPELAQATLQACRDVFQAEVPHYFRHLFTDKESVAPRVEYASGLDGPDPKCVVSMIGCTGDWFGGWDGLTPGSVDPFITADLKGGRLPEVIARGEPAIMVCHWPGLYFNGQEVGFTIFQQLVERLHAAYDNLIWMKLSELARYWAVRELTRIDRPAPGQLDLRAPFACPRFTVKVRWAGACAAIGRSSGSGRHDHTAGPRCQATVARYRNLPAPGCRSFPLLRPAAGNVETGDHVKFPGPACVSGTTPIFRRSNSAAHRRRNLHPGLLTRTGMGWIIMFCERWDADLACGPRRGGPAPCGLACSALLCPRIVLFSRVPQGPRAMGR